MKLETSTVNTLLSLMIGLQSWIVYQVYDLKAEVRLLKATHEIRLSADAK